MAARGVVGPLQLFREHLLARYVLSSPCRPAVNSLSLPRWGETPLGHPEARVGSIAAVMFL